KRTAQVFVEVRIEARVGIDSVESAYAEPLKCEVGDQRRRTGVGEHTPDLRVEHDSVLEPPSFGEREQRFVRPLAPQEKREPPRELEVADRVRLARRKIFRRAAGLRSIEETRARQHRHQALLYAGLETAQRAAGFE